MIQQALRRLLADAAAEAAPEIGLDAGSLPEPELTRPRQKEHGDWTTNLAMVLAAKAGGQQPRLIAGAIVSHLPANDLVDGAEVAGPGFINIRLKHTWLYDLLGEILERGPDFGTRPPRDERVQVEFVSANPTGPLHVGHARNTVLGDAIASVLAADGARVEREYYWNDTGTQMDLLGASVEARYLTRLGRPTDVPDGGYQGEYVDDVAGAIAEEVGNLWLDADATERRGWFVQESRRRMIDWIRATLERFGVGFDTWFSEATLQRTGGIDQAIALLRKDGYAFDEDGAVWFRATAFGDDKDRVLIRSSGEPTYFGKDVAYLRDKFSRGFGRLVYVWGADHHGDVARMRGVAEALGYDPASIEFVLYQFVSLFRGGQPVKMSKRAGDLITLDELLDEVGPDAARYTLLARSPDSPIDFDIEAVTRQSMDNPVYYVQYAHARIASLVRVAQERGVTLPPWGEVRFEELVQEAEYDLLRKLAELPEVVEFAARALAPHRIARYAEEVAADFHRFYTECRVVTDDAGLTHARLALSAAAKQVLGTSLRLLGVSAPESMERLNDDEPEA
ncbi:MAG TPA: arginine--tRNA ligase [Actinomycetota bacterium]